MKTRSVTIFILVTFSLSAKADPIGMTDGSFFGFGPAPIENTGSPLIEELGAPGSFRTQSRAVELLGNEFSRAAAQGLVDAQETPSKPTVARSTDTLQGRSNLSVITGLDRDILTSPNVPPTTTGAVCISDRKVNVVEWGDGGFKQLGKLRRDAIAENGEITPGGALKLARFYIALGFGAEANSLINYIADTSDKDVINALAGIMDKGASKHQAMRGQIFCDGKIALWAALAQPISATDIPKSTDAILSTFAELPLHLRTHLGPLLAKRFQAAGLEEQARQVLNAIVRSGTKSDESTLETAKIALSGAQSEEARQQLTELSNGTDIVAAKALLELLNDAHRREVQPLVDWVEDVPSLVRATEGTQVSQELNLAGLNGLISLGRFDEVRLALINDSLGVTNVTRAKIAMRALEAATKHASNEAFLRSVIGLSKHFEPPELSKEERFAVANRLATLGLLQRAALYLPADPTTPSEKRTASIVLSGTGQSMAAKAILEEARSDLLPEIADLLASEGNIDEALTSYIESDQSDAATHLAIQAGYWDWIEMNGVDQISEVSQSLRMPLEDESTEPINGMLIQQAQVRRDQARRLLEVLDNQELPTSFTN